MAYENNFINGILNPPKRQHGEVIITEAKDIKLKVCYQVSSSCRRVWLMSSFSPLFFAKSSQTDFLSPRVAVCWDISSYKYVHIQQLVFGITLFEDTANLNFFPVRRQTVRKKENNRAANVIVRYKRPDSSVLNPCLH